MNEPTEQSTKAPESLLKHYSTAPGIFDEMAEAPATPRAHWRALIESLQQLGGHELASRWENGRRIIREHGVTYNVYGDPQGMDRPWGLDFVPLLITAEEWARIEAGLVQRARLFNLILADIYGGSQLLLRDGFLPPELVYANPGFLRPCRGIQVTSQVYVHLLACDLGRSPDGQWWVLSDRTQAPSGTGYAWENRTVVSRILPEEIRDCNIQRLSSFFRQEREMLFRLAPPGRNHPNIILLTPGPLNETYFEHAYLARHLGFPLIEGADLTVRDRRVFLKTIEGLQPVDVILRRVDDSFCDPLELRGDSFLGVSGLLEATRAGNVTVANALGAGLMESPAFLAFLPNLCRHLLAEELLLPSIATWWCGQAEELHYVAEHLDSLILKPAFGDQLPLPLSISGPPKGRRKITEERARLIERFKAAPREFVAQERVKLSRAPAWVDEHLTARSVVVRAYVATGADAVAVLPGGLTRVSKHADDLVVSMQSGGGSKDTWVLANGAANRPEPAPVLGEPRPEEYASPGVPSRAADHLFWLGRYTERLEQLLRVLSCVLGRVSGEAGGEDSRESTGLAGLAVHLGLFPGPLSGEPSHGELSQRMLRVLYEPDEPGGARELLKRIRFIASTVRDRFSGDTWRILGRLEMDARARPGRLPLARATRLIHNLVLDLAAFNGMEMENMTRGHGWRFLDFGRRLERGLSVLKLLRAAASVESSAATALEPVLEIADSVMTYRRRYFTAPRLACLLDLLLRDESNPRSLLFQVNVLGEHAAALAADSKSAAARLDQERIQKLKTGVRSVVLEEPGVQDASEAGQPLLHLLTTWATDLAGLSDQVTNRYFSHSIPRMSQG
ncbi:MAG TPA: circularly permuted type 2 ATP-grasp protein [Candidatus Binatia bacterium]|jgi:uncharacterized circularly permuted ATP-grasp superfamily protein/uncharacterized alpha-E superfamily protein|nr:circularly permuted type 2 ATP-grasp protein [Candidatus Binatia bacterium]